MSFQEFSLNSNVKNNLDKLKKNIESVNLHCILKKGTIKFNQIDGLS